jgi:MFS family permease
MTSGRPSMDAIALLRENGPFRALWVSRAISFIGDSLGLVALLLYVAGEVGSGTAVALLLLVGDFTPTLFSPLTGALSDRFDRKPLMIGSELAQGAIIAVIALASLPFSLLLVLVALGTILSGVFQPASRSAVASLVPDDRLESANATLGIGTHGFELVGPLLAAGVLPFVGVRGLLLVDAATFVVSALLLARLPALPPYTEEREGRERAPFLQGTADGLRFIWTHRALKILTVGFCTAVAFSASDDVALIFLAQGPLNGGESAASLLYAGAGTGLLLGFALLSGYGARLSAILLLVFGFGLGSGGNLLTGLSWSISAAFVMQAIRGLGISLIDVGSNTLIQRTVPRGMQGRVFANFYGAIGLAAGLSYAVGGFLLDATGPRTVLILGGLGGLAATLGLWLKLPEALLPRRDAEPRPVADGANEDLM